MTTKRPLLLVAEDETLLHLPLEDELTSVGYEVVLVENGTKAIAQLNEKSAEFSALITDVRMGRGPNGWEVAHRARELVPTLPIIYMSGDSASQWAANGVPKSMMLPKPFAMAQLVTAISQLINEAQSVAG